MFLGRKLQLLYRFPGFSHPVCLRWSALRRLRSMATASFFPSNADFVSLMATNISAVQASNLQCRVETRAQKALGPHGLKDVQRGPSAGKGRRWAERSKGGLGLAALYRYCERQIKKVPLTFMCRGLRV
ncbi:hypothetical protein NDU88_006212 [Pleurodeles waltl]|uniref:Uncharacterized protein n=1 Tax=Pleurodeles waltl TaxID=8319 RepID=A0AAV7X3K1_PLEWA|nr:hypothetical protein NDU88_006212 [Pleurodeles waltl]